MDRGNGASGAGAWRRKDLRVSTSQIATTIATLVGEDFRAASPQAAAPLPTGK